MLWLLFGAIKAILFTFTCILLTWWLQTCTSFVLAFVFYRTTNKNDRSCNSGAKPEIVFKVFCNSSLVLLTTFYHSHKYFAVWFSKYSLVSEFKIPLKVIELQKVTSTNRYICTLWCSGHDNQFTFTLFQQVTEFLAILPALQSR